MKRVLRAGCTAMQKDVSLLNLEIIKILNFMLCTYRCRSVTKLCLTLCEPMNCSMPGSSVLHYLPEFAQIPVHRAGDAIQPYHPLLSPPLPAFNLSLRQGLFQWMDSWHQVAKVLEVILHLQSFRWIFRVDFLYDWVVWPPCSPRDSKESSPTPPSEGINSLALSLSYCPALTSTYDYWKNHCFG